ncbi:hypothetical protein EG329_006562 [Mollisiaceae sp. DMI_Dod_QoI]|nr:hypothetical protein EG329_006562 [Helotiales sp. DMI_Dod_QoI]
MEQQLETVCDFVTKQGTQFCKPTPLRGRHRSLSLMAALSPIHCLGWDFKLQDKAIWGPELLPHRSRTLVRWNITTLIWPETCPNFMLLGTQLPKSHRRHHHSDLALTTTILHVDCYSRRSPEYQRHALCEEDHKIDRFTYFVTTERARKDQSKNAPLPVCRGPLNDKFRLEGYISGSYHSPSRLVLVPLIEPKSKPSPTLSTTGPPCQFSPLKWYLKD